MTTVNRWTGRESRLLREALRLSVRDFAARLGVGVRTVSKWEAGKTTICPRPEMQAALDTALAHAPDDTRTRFGRSLQPDEDPHGEHDTNRRDATKLLTMALVATSQPAFDAVERLASGSHTRVDRKLIAAHREFAGTLAGLYRSADPRIALPSATAYADSVIELLDAPMGESEAAELTAIVVDIHAQIGLWACHMHRPSLAYRYLATACEVARTTSDGLVQARALGALSYLFSSAPRGGHGGNPQRALALLTEALELAKRADGFTIGWLTTWRADQYATLGQVVAAQQDVEQAESGLDASDDRTLGFFARQSYGYGMGGHLDSVRGVVSSLAGDHDAADASFGQVQAEAANMRRRIATYGHLALAQAKVNQPEASCAALSRSADLAVSEHYSMGLTRAVGVRAGFDERWRSLACVRDLDEQLRQLVA